MQIILTDNTEIINSILIEFFKRKMKKRLAVQEKDAENAMH